MRRRRPFLLSLLVLALFVAGCAGSEPDEDAADDLPAEPGDTGTETDTEAGAERVVDPTPGGEVTFLVEGETATWDLPNAECATSCINVLRLAADPLFVEDVDGTPQPFLLESSTSDEAFTTWTLVLRPGITFQNGEPLDADALALDLENKIAGLVTGPVLAGATAVTSDGDRTVTITFDAPHSSLPHELASLPGFVMAPAFYTDHDRDAGGPIGTGPFVFDQWSPSERTVLVRNDDYWRTDVEGRSLPHLDRVVVRPVPSKTDREAIIEAGDADLAHVDDVESPDRWLDDWDGGLLTSDLSQETSYGMFNADAEPFDDPAARLAVAQCTDRETFNQLINPASTTASGPFSPGSIGHLDDAGFPAFDPVAGTALVDSLGGLSFDYLTTDDASERLAADLLVSMWRQCGIDASFSQASQSEVITRALFGDFQMVSWRLHGSTNPAVEGIWWSSDNAGAIALNAGRIRDAEIDAALEAMRANDDPATLAEQAEAVNRRFGETVHNLWYAWSEWWIIHQADVRDVGVLDLPDGGQANPKTHGSVWLHQAWLDAG